MADLFALKEDFCKSEKKMNRKRQRKDSLHMSKRHLNRKTRLESDIICDALFNTASHETLHTNVNDTCTEGIENVSIMDFKIEMDNNFTEINNVHNVNESINGTSGKSKDNDECIQSVYYTSDSQQSALSEESIPYLSDDLATIDSRFTNDLAIWAVKYQISHTALRALLHRLRKHSCFSTLSLDPKTLLKTLRKQEIRIIPPGTYDHFGVQNSVSKISAKDNIDCVKIEVNYDELPVSKSSLQQFNSNLDSLHATHLSCGKELSNENNVPMPTSSPKHDEVYEGGSLSHCEEWNDNKIYIKSLLNETAALSPQFNDEEKNFKHFVITKLINLESALNDIKKSVKTMSEKLSIDSCDKNEQENIDTLKDFPLKKQEDLETLEMKLQNDAGYRAEMMKQLTRIKSGCMKTSCIRIMRLIFSNQLAIKYSWFGAKKKHIFSTLNICKVILNVIRKSHPDTSDDQISAPIKIWLAHAKERMERENQRETQPQN